MWTCPHADYIYVIQLTPPNPLVDDYIKYLSYLSLSIYL